MATAAERMRALRERARRPFIQRTAPADFPPNDQLRRNATALPPHVTMSHTSENSAGLEALPGPAGPERNVG
jgi:hypothetical protein